MEQRDHRRRGARRLASGALAAVAAVNGLWMLIDPGGWFAAIPGVDGTGPLNAHLVRDVGCAYLAVATAFAWAAVRPAQGFGALLVAAAFLALHALLHGAETVAGHAGHPLTELLGVWLPALAAVLFARWYRDG